MWKPIAGADGYQISSYGEVRSPRGIILKPVNGGRRGLTVTLPGQRRRSVHHLVLEAFVGPRPNGLMGRHLDDDKTNNRLENLVWGTRSENTHDSVRNGTHNNARKTACKHGHPFEGENIRIDADGERVCRECQRIRRAKFVERHQLTPGGRPRQ